MPEEAVVMLKALGLTILTLLALAVIVVVAALTR